MSTETTPTTDYASAYHELRVRLSALVRDEPDAALEAVAPATPEWRVRDVVAHLGGVCDDIVHGNMSGVASNAWTQAQVDKRRDWPFPRVLDEWFDDASVVEGTMNDFGTAIGQMVFDAWTHEQDVRGALGAPGARDGAAFEIAWSWFVDANQALGATEPGAWRVLTETGETRLGGGDEPVATLRTSRYELLRAVTGRRSRAQVQAFDADGADLVVLLFPTDFFTPASHDIVE